MNKTISEYTSLCSDTYSKSPVIRSLISLISIKNPLIGACDSLIVNAISNIQNSKLEDFFRELENGNIQLSEEKVKSVDFLNKYMITVKAVMETNRKEKIQSLARLFKNEEILNTDLYEEYLNILNDLSYVEFCILIKLHKYENKYPINEGENKLQRSEKFWPEFIREVEHDLDINQNEIRGILTRISRTGCYEPINGAYLSYTGGKGYVTPVFYKIVELIDNH